MFKIVGRCWPSFVWLCISLPLSAEVQVVKNSPAPNHIRAVVLAAGWIDQIPKTQRVNAPDFLTTLFPGQKIALALTAEGPERDTLLNDLKVDVRFSSPTHGVTQELHLNPGSYRDLKAQGADISLMVLKVAGLDKKDLVAVERSTCLLTCAVVVPTWSVPMVDQGEDIQITVSISGGRSPNTIDPLSLSVRPSADWLNDPLPTPGETGQFMTGYHEDLSPGRLLTLLRAVVEFRILNNPAVKSYFVMAYQNNVVARQTAVALYPLLDGKTQKAFLYILSLGGQDLHALFPALPAEAIAPLAKVVPMTDPRSLPRFHDPVSPGSVAGIGLIMDQCWAGWSTTGDQSYLRALVGLLEGAPDYAAYQSWKKSHGGQKDLNAQIGRGLAYQIAGWSLSSFQRTDPHVSDWLIFWQNNPTFPPLLRKEIAGLWSNPAFRRE